VPTLVSASWKLPPAGRIQGDASTPGTLPPTLARTVPAPSRRSSVSYLALMASQLACLAIFWILFGDVLSR
jgi:hypothetical protein